MADSLDGAQPGTVGGEGRQRTASDGRIARRWKDASEIEEKRRRELERRNCTKYHYVKFVERKKVNRKLNTCKRLLLEAEKAGDKEEVASQKKQMRSHLEDMEYIEHYPRHLPYNALFPAADSEASRKRREEIRKLIKAKLEAEEAEGEEGGEAEEEGEPSAKKGSGKAKRKAAAAPAEEPPAPKKPKDAKAAVAVAVEESSEPKTMSSGARQRLARKEKAAAAAAAGEAPPAPKTRKSGGAAEQPEEVPPAPKKEPTAAAEGGGKKKRRKLAA